MLSIRDFSDDDITELRSYIQVHIPVSVLNETYALTEKPEDKIKNFTTMFRIIFSCMNLCSKQEIKDKLNSILNEVKDVYNKLYKLQVMKTTKTTTFGMNRINSQIASVFVDQDINSKVNAMQDFFIVLAEKIEPLNMNKTAGIELESPEGQGVYTDISAEDEVSASSEEL